MNEEERDIEKESFKLHILIFFRLLVKLLIHLLVLLMLCIYLEERINNCYLVYNWDILFIRTNNLFRIY